MAPDTPSFSEKEPDISKGTKTPEQKILETLEKYGVDPEIYKGDIQRINALYEQKRKNSLDEDKAVQIAAEELFREYLKENPDKISLDTISNSLDDRIKYATKMFNESFEEHFAKYDFLNGKIGNTETKEILKIGMVNSMINSPMMDVVESLMGGFINEAGNENNFDSVAGTDENGKPEAEAKEKPKNSGRAKFLEGEYDKYIKSFQKKFDEINQLFTQKYSNLNPEQKQKIISNTPWFRNPELIEKGIGDLSVVEIENYINEKLTNLENLEVNTFSEDELKKLSQYMINTREKLGHLEGKMGVVEMFEDALYTFGDIKTPFGKIAETLFKIPFFGKLLAAFLGLDPENALAEYNENNELYKLFGPLKRLGAKKDKDGNKIEGEGAFKNIDLSHISLNGLKNEIKYIKQNVNISTKKDFWLQAFSDDGYKSKEGAIPIKFTLSDEQKLKDKLANSEMKDILKKGIADYKGKVEEKKQEKEKEEDKVNGEIATRKTRLETEKSEIENVDKNNLERENALKILIGGCIPDQIENLKNLGDIEKIIKPIIEGIKKINLKDLKSKSIDENFVKDIVGNNSEEIKKAVILSLNIVNEYVGSETNGNIGDLMKKQDFFNYLNNERMKKINPERRENSERTSLINLVNKINKESLKTIKDGKITIDGKSYTIDLGNVKFENEKFTIDGMEIPDEVIINGLQEAINTGTEYNYEFMGKNLNFKPLVKTE